MITLPWDVSIKPFIKDLNEKFDLDLSYVEKNAKLSQWEFSTVKQLFRLLWQNKEQIINSVKKETDKRIKENPLISMDESLLDWSNNSVPYLNKQIEALEQYLWYNNSSEEWNNIYLTTAHKDEIYSKKVLLMQELDKQYISADKVREQFPGKDGIARLHKFIEEDSISIVEYKKLLKMINLMKNPGEGELLVSLLESIFLQWKDLLSSKVNYIQELLNNEYAINYIIKKGESSQSKFVSIFIKNPAIVLSVLTIKDRYETFDILDFYSIMWNDLAVDLLKRIYVKQQIPDWIVNDRLSRLSIHLIKNLCDSGGSFLAVEIILWLNDMYLEKYLGKHTNTAQYEKFKTRLKFIIGNKPYSPHKIENFIKKVNEKSRLPRW